MIAALMYAGVCSNSGNASPRQLINVLAAARFSASVLLDGGGIYNGLHGTLTTTGVTGGPMLVGRNTGARGGGIAAVDSGTTTMTQTAVTTNVAVLTAGGVYRQGGTMTNNNSPISGNLTNNCLGSVPAVPGCTG
ncbi:hypothetical protein ABZX92_39500 [Lentzea sp. NPDC006480]|uniref:hypothetical protein n=1 Tax=Lentzea sp. NPDC006480 TaxID=3157176 RepID=UPI0033B90256